MEREADLVDLKPLQVQGKKNISEFVFVEALIRFHVPFLGSIFEVPSMGKRVSAAANRFDFYGRVVLDQ